MVNVCPEQLGDALQWAKTELRSSPTSSLDAQLLMSHVLRRDRAWVLAHEDAQLTASERDMYAAAVARRRKGEPVAYIRGFAEWADMRLEVNHGSLVPRPETELLAEAAATFAAQRGARVVADIGTGSGAITIFLARRIATIEVDAVDISREAVEVAERNVRDNGVSQRVTLLVGDLLHPLRRRPDLVVANLPYLSDSMMKTIGPDVAHEPVRALHGGKTGLEVYQRLLNQLKERKWDVPLLFEIDARQREPIQAMLRNVFVGGSVLVERDLAGLDRVVIRKPAEQYA